MWQSSSNKSHVGFFGFRVTEAAAEGTGKRRSLRLLFASQSTEAAAAPSVRRFMSAPRRAPQHSAGGLGELFFPLSGGTRRLLVGFSDRSNNLTLRGLPNTGAPMEHRGTGYVMSVQGRREEKNPG